jgi:hypothetical protein
MSDGVGRPSADAEHQYSLAYEELRLLAASVLTGEAFATISPTTLVHEAWLKLKASRPIQAESELHFKRIAARAMRQVLVDAARRRNSEKHGGGLVLVSFDEEIDRGRGRPRASHRTLGPAGRGLPGRRP